MKVLFTRWCLDPKGRTDVAVEPSRVDAVEFFSQGFTHPVDKEYYPHATKLIMRGKQEYIVQGSVDYVTDVLNLSDSKPRDRFGQIQDEKLLNQNPSEEEVKQWRT